MSNLKLKIKLNKFAHNLVGKHWHGSCRVEGREKKAKIMDNINISVQLSKMTATQKIGTKDDSDKTSKDVFGQLMMAPGNNNENLTDLGGTQSEQNIGKVNLSLFSCFEDPTALDAVGIDKMEVKKLKTQSESIALTVETANTAYSEICENSIVAINMPEKKQRLLEVLVGDAEVPTKGEIAVSALSKQNLDLELPNQQDTPVVFEYLPGITIPSNPSNHLSFLTSNRAMKVKHEQINFHTSASNSVEPKNIGINKISDLAYTLGNDANRNPNISQDAKQPKIDDISSQILEVTNVPNQELVGQQIPAISAQIKSTEQPMNSNLDVPVVDTTDTHWVETLSAHIEMTFSEAGGEAELTLTPENLGPIRLRMEIKDGTAHVTIVTETADAARIFNLNENRLSEALSKSGITLSSQDATMNQQREQRHQQGWFQTARDRSNNTSSDNTTKGEISINSIDSRLVNLIA